MRIDLPRCSLKTCSYYTDGNCADKSQHDRCELYINKEFVERQRELDGERRVGLSAIYESPIRVMVSEANQRVEDGILKIAQNIGIDVDKEELHRALNYDRDQYDKGYEDAMKQIVHCCECKRWIPDAGRCSWNGGEKTCNNDFCSRGVRV